MRRSAAIRGGSWYTREPSKKPAFARIGHYEFTDGQITGFRVKFRTGIPIRDKETTMVRRNDEEDARRMRCRIDGSDSPFAEWGRGLPAVSNEDLRARIKELLAEKQRLQSIIASLMPGDAGRVE